MTRTQKRMQQKKMADRRKLWEKDHGWSNWPKKMAKPSYLSELLTKGGVRDLDDLLDLVSEVRNSLTADNPPTKDRIYLEIPSSSSCSKKIYFGSLPGEFTYNMVVVFSLFFEPQPN